MARTFQITEIFPELTVFENVRIAAEVAGGYRLRPWINRSEAEKIHRTVEDTLKLVSLETKSRSIGRRACPRRSAGRRDRDGAGVEAASVAAR